MSKKMEEKVEWEDTKKWGQTNERKNRSTKWKNKVGKETGTRKWRKKVR